MAFVQLNETCLHLAVKLPQNCVILEDLIANGTQLEARDDRGKTALMIATANENLQAVNTLLKYGSNTYSSDEDMRHSFKVNRNNMRNNMRSFHTETDSADSWPDTEDEDNNYERPVTKESNKSRKESFKSNSFRVSSLVDETIVEELKTDDNNEENDDYVICKPSTSREENVGGVDNQDKQKDIKLIWNESSSSSEDDINKADESGTLGRTDTLKVGEEVWVNNAINQKQIDKDLDSDPFNVDVMDELEMLLMQDQTGHNKNVDFITQMKNLLDEEPPKPKDTSIRSPPTQPLESPPDMKPVNVKTEQTVNQVMSKQSADNNSDKKESPINGANSGANSGHKSLNKLRRESKVDIEDLPTPKTTNKEEVRRRSYSELKQTNGYSQVNGSEDNRRRSYAEVVAQKSNKQMFLDELKTNISARAKSYADVVSPSVSPEFEPTKETKIPIFRANSNSSPNRHNIQRQTSNPRQSKSPKHTQNVENGKQSLVEMNNAINNNINTNNNINNNNKVLSKIPLPVKQSPTDTVRPNPSETQTSTSDESVATEDDSRRQSTPTIQMSDTSPKSNGKVKTGALRSSKLRRKVNELNDELKKGMNEKSLLMSENQTIKRQLSELNEKIREESHHKFELEKRLIKLEAELSQYRFECDMKCKENKAIKTELEHIVTTFEDNQKQCRYLEEENQKMLSKIKSMKLEEEVLNQKLNQQTVPYPPVCDHEDLVIEWKSRLEELSIENGRLKREVEDLQKISIEKQLDYERELFEWQKRNLEIDSDLKRLQLEIQVNSIKTTPEEQIELLKAVRDLNNLMAKLDERITKNEDQLYYKSRNFNEEMFDCARNLLDQMRLELTNFKEMLTNTANRDDKSENEEKQLNAFETRISELRSSLEGLEDQIQSQELQLIRQSDIISFASPLRKSSSSRELFISSNNKPKSWFVQTLFRLQSHIQSTAPTGESITAFAHQKTRLQKQIHELKSELGIFAESVH